MSDWTEWSNIRVIVLRRGEKKPRKTTWADFVRGRDSNTYAFPLGYKPAKGDLLSDGKTVVQVVTKSVQPSELARNHPYYIIIVQ